MVANYWGIIGGGDDVLTSRHRHTWDAAYRQLPGVASPSDSDLRAKVGRDPW